MKTTDSRDPTIHWELFIRQRGSATQGVPPGKEALTWVANTVTLIWGERDALLVDTFLSDAQTTELADWIEAKGRTLRTIYLTHGHPDHFLAPIRQRPHIADLKMSAPQHRHQQIHRSEQGNGAREESQCESDGGNELDRSGEYNL